MIAFNRGSVPEIIEDDLTGFVVEGKEEAVAATDRLCRLSRRAIRQRFEERFTTRRMAREYLIVYRSLIEKRHTDSCLDGVRRTLENPATIAGNFIEKSHSKSFGDVAGHDGDVIDLPRDFCWRRRSDVA